MVKVTTMKFYFHTIIDPGDKMKYQDSYFEKSKVPEYLLNGIHIILQAIIAAVFNYLIIDYLF